MAVKDTRRPNTKTGPNVTSGKEAPAGKTKKEFFLVRFFRRINHKYVKPWFFSQDDPTRIKVPYVISFVFIVLTVVSIQIHLAIKIWQFDEIRKLWNAGGITSLNEIERLAKLDISLVPLITVLVSTAGLFIGLYNWGKRKKIGANGIPQYRGNTAGDGAFSPNEE